MSAIQYINVADFMQHLKDNNLVIVNQGELELNNEIVRGKLLRRKSLTLSEIISAKFFNVTDSETLRRWCLNGKFPKDTFYQDKNKVYRIMTAQIKAMIY
jgi:hypothetical protein